MSYTITVGATRSNLSAAAEELAIPALDAVSTMQAGFGTAYQAVKDAADKRVGVVLVGTKWSGKTEAIQRVIRVMRDEEDAILALKPETYKKKAFLYVHGLQSKSARDLLASLLKVVSPAHRERVHGARKSDDDLRADLIAALRNKNYGVIIFDEAEYLADVAMDQLRKIMADASAFADNRVIQTTTGEAYRSAGVGIVLVGTPPMVDVVRRSEDASRRWFGFYAMPLIAPGEVSAVYDAIFPRFAEHVAQVGADAWRAFHEQHVARGQPVAVGLLTMHARAYFSQVFDSDAASVHRITSRETAPFVREIFLHALNQMSWATDVERVRSNR